MFLIFLKSQIVPYCKNSHCLKEFIFTFCNINKWNIDNFGEKTFFIEKCYETRIVGATRRTVFGIFHLIFFFIIGQKTIYFFFEQKINLLFFQKINMNNSWFVFIMKWIKNIPFESLLCIIIPFAFESLKLLSAIF